MENNLTNKNKAMSIFWWTIKRYIPVSIAYWILLFASLPMIEAFMAIVITADTKHFSEYVDTMKKGAIYIAGTGFAGIAVVFSIVVAMIGFSYMHNKRSVDFFGSLPVSRRTMFFSRLVAVILLTIVPVILFGAIGACVAGSFVAAGAIVKVVGYIILATIANITIIAFISLCCGSVVDILISYAAINIAFPICIAVFNFFPSTVIPGMGEELWSASIYTMFCPIASVFTMAFGNGKVLGIIWWVVLTAITILGCYIVCKKRKAELAQNTYTFSAVEVVIKFIVCSLAGLGLGWIMAYVGSVHKTIEAQYIYFAIGLVSGIMVANILLHLVFHRGLVRFSKSLIQCGIVLMVCVSYTLIVATGLFGYDTDVPESAEIKSVAMLYGVEEEFYIDGKNVLVNTETDKDIIKGISDVHKKIIEGNKEKQKWGLYPLTGLEQVQYVNNTSVYVNDMKDSAIDYYSDSNYYDIQVNIIYELTDGTQFTRNYSYGEINTNINGELYTATNNENIIDLIPPKYMSSMNIDAWEDGTYSYFEVKNNEEKIIEAVKKDIEIYGEIKVGNAIGNIYIEYEDERYNWTTATIYFDRSYVNTLSALKEAGYSNFKYSYFNDLSLLTSGVGIKTEQSIYFKLPKGMDPNKEIRCLQGYRYEGAYMFNISDERTLCEHVEGDIWKYTLYEMKTFDKQYYEGLRQGIIICQVEEDTVIDTGMILLDKDATNNMLTIGDRKLNKKGNPTDNDFYKPIYNYEWTKYEE